MVWRGEGLYLEAHLIVVIQGAILGFKRFPEIIFYLFHAVAICRPLDLLHVKNGMCLSLLACHQTNWHQYLSNEIDW